MWWPTLNKLHITAVSCTMKIKSMMRQVSQANNSALQRNGRYSSYSADFRPRLFDIPKKGKQEVCPTLPAPRLEYFLLIYPPKPMPFLR